MTDLRYPETEQRRERRVAMPWAMRLLLSLALLVALAKTTRAQYPAKCDANRDCIGRAITTTVTYGKGAQYTDVDTSYRLANFDTAITFEAWISPQPQPGKIQYIAGLWGPNKDNNDQWVLYLRDNTLTFALSMDNSYKGDSDNTIVTATVPTMYTTPWHHIAAEWDAGSRQARLYIDGVFAASAGNAVYPLMRLHRPENRLLPLQIGSSNALYDDTLNRRSFKGQIDEVRLWRRSLSDAEIACQRLVSLNGNEPGLELYYRCNEAPGSQYLCDATGNNHIGLLRSGAYCDSSHRVVPLTYTVTPTAATAKLICTEDTVFTFTLTDTSLCGDRVVIGLYGRDANLFKVSRSSILLAKGVPDTFSVSVHTDLIGQVVAGVYVYNANSCGLPVYIPLTIDRTTELQYSTTRLVLDTLYVGCQSMTMSETSLKICNPNHRIIRLDSVTLDSNHFTIATPGITFPKFLPPDSCVTILVRMSTLDTSKTLLDTLRVASNELCHGAGIIPVSGRVQEVLGLLTNDGRGRLKAMNFGIVCPGQISGTVSFQYRDLAADSLIVDSIDYEPANFFGAGMAMPLRLPPRAALPATYARFRPTHPGSYTGTLTVGATYHGCRIVKVIPLTAQGYSVDVDYLTPAVLFGNVTIGKTATQSAVVIDSGNDPRAMDSYLRVGDVYTITGGRSFSLTKLSTQAISLLFRPRQPMTYYDTLCMIPSRTGRSAPGPPTRSTSPTLRTMSRVTASMKPTST